MCGIAGFIDFAQQLNSEEYPRITNEMSNRLVRRGPDDTGSWIEKETGVALGHRRLSIIDLSVEGRQPMMSSCKRYVVIYNGEIYNYREIRKDLENDSGFSGPEWRGHSDTEILLAAIQAWGIEETLKRLNGMFAFALWDRKSRVMYLTRDRFGEKPLYYGVINKNFIFGSELNALKAHPFWAGTINRNALASYMRHGYVPAPYSIYENIFKIIPGTVLQFDYKKGDHSGSNLTLSKYWCMKEVAENCTQNLFRGSDGDAIEILEDLLIKSVRSRMVSDVPLGAFLSGGIDSSTVVALMQSVSKEPVKTFSIGFNEDGYNEAVHARAVAQYLKTDHTELILTSDKAMSIIPQLPQLYNEPFADSSQIPTFLVSRLAREKVIVCLSGDGGDEIFGGYKRYTAGNDLWSIFGWLPLWSRVLFAKILLSVPERILNQCFGWTGPIMNRYGRPGLASDKLYKLAEILRVRRPEMLYQMIVSHWKNPSELVIGASEPSTVFTNEMKWAQVKDVFHSMMFLDTVTYLPDDILVKLDRASMGVSLESRVPLLDPDLVQFAWKLPLSKKVRSGEGKWILKQILYKYVPRELIERPKMGFGVPIGDWLRGPLKDWAAALLDEKRLKRENFLNPQLVKEKWDEHLSEKQNWQGYLWDVLMFQAWLESR